jgi:hypothetical protein
MIEKKIGFFASFISKEEKLMQKHTKKLLKKPLSNRLEIRKINKIER